MGLLAATTRTASDFAATRATHARSRADGRSLAATARVTFVAMFRNLVTLSCFVGIAFNLLALPVPDFLIQPMDMMARAALPTALFALGGVLSQYRIRSALGEAAVIAAAESGVVAIAVEAARQLL